MSVDLATAVAVTASETNTRRAPLRKFLRVALWLLIAVELGLFFLLRSVGWIRTGDTLQLVVACVIVALPVITVGGILVWNRFRFGMRSLLLFMCCTAAFFWISAIPFWRFEQARMGTRSLRDAKIQYHLNANSVFWNANHLDQADQDFLYRSSPSRASFWLAPFVKNSSRLPEDRALQQILLQNESELQFFLDRHDSFEGLLSIQINASSPESLARLKKILPKHKTLKEIICNFSKAEIPLLFWEIVRENEIPMLQIGLPSLAFEEPWFPSDIPEWQFLRTISLSGSPRNKPTLNTLDLETLRRCKQLRSLKLYSIRTREAHGLKKALPNCNVIDY